ncbi:MAG: hypothetical protein ILO53_08705 [Clostridia bacterium]|nr:hypothetical protein [Clostridia bacterium]
MILAGVLMLSIVAVMVFLIIRNAQDVKAREDEKKRKKEKPRFARLGELDRRAGELRKGPEEDYKGTLSAFCSDFRDYAAAELGLYYAPGVIRAFVSSLAVTKLMVLQGVSGTGKTSLPYAFGKFICRDAAVVPVQPSWKDKSDILGYNNEFTDRFTETELLYMLYEANLSKDVFVVILDEMNIARIEYYFADFLSLLEIPDPEARLIEVVSATRKSDPKLMKNGKLLIPENVWFVGTANNDDSTLAISDKVYDRAMVLELSSRAEPFGAVNPGTRHVTCKDLSRMFEEALRHGRMSDNMRAKIGLLDAVLVDRFGITFGNRILRQTEGFVPVFVEAGGTEEEAVDIILCKKVLRKLDNLNPVIVSARADSLVKKINEIFGENAMPACLAYLAKYSGN